MYTLSIYTIRSPGELEITLDEVQNVLCFGDSTGKISVTVSGGTQLITTYG